MASYNGGAQECIARGEAEVEPAGFLLALLGDQHGTACSFGSPHALPEVIAMGVGHIQEGALARGEVPRWVLGLLQRDLVGLSFRTGLSCPLGVSDGVTLIDEIPEAQRPTDDVILHRQVLCGAYRFRHMQVLRKSQRCVADTFQDLFVRGQYLAALDKSSPNEPVGLFLLSVETGEKRRLTEPPLNILGDSGPAFSSFPDELGGRGNHTAHLQRVRW